MRLSWMRGSSTRAAVTDLVEERDLGLPDRPRWCREANSAGAVGEGEADEIGEL
jgi:hypothetical protein